MPAQIVFDSDHKLDVDESPDDVQGMVDSVTSPHVPLLKLTVGGKPVWVNAAQIRVVTEPGPPSTVTFAS